MTLGVSTDRLLLPTSWLWSGWDELGGRPEVELGRREAPGSCLPPPTPCRATHVQGCTGKHGLLVQTRWVIRSVVGGGAWSAARGQSPRTAWKADGDPVC